MRVRPFLRHEGHVDGIVDSARRREGLAFMIFPQYTSMKSMVFRVSDQKYYMTHISSLRLLFRLVACGCVRLVALDELEGHGTALPMDISQQKESFQWLKKVLFMSS